MSAWKYNHNLTCTPCQHRDRGRDFHPSTTRPNSCMIIFHLGFPWQKRSMRDSTRNISDRKENWRGNGWTFATEGTTSIPSTISTSSSYQLSLRKGQEISVCQINTITMPVGQMKVRHTDADFTLKRVFGKSSFRWDVVVINTRSQYWLNVRPFQREVITAALDGEDVYLQAATSFGKSLCFQLPAVIDYGSKETCSLKKNFPYWPLQSP